MLQFFILAMASSYAILYKNYASNKKLSRRLVYRPKICWLKKSMKKKESLWELLKRLDEEAGQFNLHLSEANRFFDSAAIETKAQLEKHEKDLHKTIGKVRKALKTFLKQKGEEKGKKNK